MLHEASTAGEVHVFEASHMLLETNFEEVVGLMREFCCRGYSCRDYSFRGATHYIAHNTTRRGRKF